MEFRSDAEIYEQLQSYLSGRISLDDFEDWFVPRSWNFQAANPSLQNLVSEIELLLAEYSNLHISNESFRNELHRIAGAPLSVVQAGVNIRIDQRFAFVPFGTLNVVLSFPQRIAEDREQDRIESVAHTTALTTIVTLRESNLPSVSTPLLESSPQCESPAFDHEFAV